MICVSIGRTRHRMVVAEHKALAERGAALVELRLDWIQRAPDLGRLISDRPTATVVTCRRPSDQGRWAGTEEQRQLLLRTAILAGVEYVDIEDDIAQSLRRYGKTKRIISHHNFEETPDNIEEIAARLAGMDADIVKLVTMAQEPADCVRMMRVVQQAKVPTIGFCMGEFGQLSRILCIKYGSPFTYGTFNRDRVLAPGQLSFDEMKNVYRVDRINSETQVFGVLGDPIAQSRSPILHNAAFEKAGINAVYLPLRVPAEILSRTLDALDELDFRGYSVTIPHKETVHAKFPPSREIVTDIGAANTLFKTEAGMWQTDNTDYTAAMESLLGALNPGETLEGKRTLILGAGGAARAIALGCLRAGAAVTLSSRTAKRGTALAEELTCRFTSWENRGAENADILINCTPVGMHPDVNDTPFMGTWLRDEMLVFDTIYNPEQTLLIKEARQRTCRTITGVEMFCRQAAAQFQIFTGHAVPLEFWEETLRKGISAAKSVE